jgi:opacity protein-like surface antigen
VFRLGGGVEIPVHKAVSATVGYDFTRMGVSTPINVGTLNGGIGLRS